MLMDVATQTNIVINEPAPLSTTFSSSNVNCYGGNNANASAIASGGTSFTIISQQMGKQALKQLDCQRVYISVL